MKTKYRTLLLGVAALIAGCRESDENIFAPTPETAVISCEAAHVTIEIAPSGWEEFDGND